MLKELEDELNKVLDLENVSLFFIEDNKYGDIYTNISMIEAKKRLVSPHELAFNFIQKINISGLFSSIFSDIEPAGPGFINFTFTDEFLKNNLNTKLEEIKESIKINNEILDKNNLSLNGKNVLVEYTDPNPFKVFHIGHLMANTIGEFVARAAGARGAHITRLNYQGDVGRHIAINIYAILKSENYKKFIELAKEDCTLSIKEKVTWLGEMYAEGYADFEVDENRTDGLEKSVVVEVADINKKVYEKQDEKSSILINEIYALGRAWSLEYFETLYKTLGTKFDKYIFESEAALFGKHIVENNTIKEIVKDKNGEINIDSGIFEIGDEGAIIFDGERREVNGKKLHTRVFINKNGLPTYEAKDLGNFDIKIKSYPETDISIVVTASEQNDYFKVINKSIQELEAINAFGKMMGEESDVNIKKSVINIHMGHGMMRFAEGKMSSRKGNIIAGDELIEIVKENLKDKFEKSRVEDKDEREFLIEKVAIGAIKYAVLKQAIGKDVIFDIEKAISVDGDSGPYLQYTHARISGIVNKNENKLATDSEDSLDLSSLEINQNNKNLILNILKYEKVLSESVSEFAPQKMLSYLITLAHSFNSFYNNEKIDGSQNNIFLATKVKNILADGLDLLGIHAPNRM